jgi:hypothetical protein
LNVTSNTITDYLMGAWALVLAWRLADSRAGAPRQLWSASFCALAAAAFIGGTWHGVSPAGFPVLTGWLWSLSYVAHGLADLLLLWGAASFTLGRWSRLAVVYLLVARFADYASKVLLGHDFRDIALEFAVTLVGLLLFGLELARRRDPSAPLVLGGAAVSFFAGLLLQAGVTLSPRFLNDNDLFHLIQMAGLWLLFHAGLVFGKV